MENERFPALTAEILKGKSIAVDQLRYIARTGWTTLNLMNAIAAENPVKNNDIVTLLIGVNDQYQGVDTASYRTRFRQLLNISIELAGNRKTRVFVLSIPDYSATPFVSASDKNRVSKEIDWFNAINKQETLQMNVAYIDITPSTRQAAFDPTLIASDGLHPSGKEYRKWAEMLAPMVDAAMK
jgi:lysophospholipase L1-like esterase